MNIGEQIKVYRKKSKLTQEQLSIKSGLSRNAIYNYESGKRSPKIETISNIANALNIAISELLNSTNSKKIEIANNELSETNDNILGINIKKYRTALNISREEMANKLKVSIPTIAKYEQGQREPNITTLKQIANILNASIDVLCGMKKETSKSLEDYTNLELVQLIEKASKILKNKYNH